MPCLQSSLREFEFSEGVRVLVFSDSCHSGTVTKASLLESNEMLDSQELSLDIYGSGSMYSKGKGMIDPQERYRYMPIDIGLRVYMANKTFYDKILEDINLSNVEDKIMASILLISGCQDDQFSRDGERNGLFTSQLLYVWNRGNCNKSYRQFYNEIMGLMPKGPKVQTPNFYLTGKINPKFEEQQVFEI